jgi:hypothetical protein
VPETVNTSMLELLTWISSRPRTYGEAMQAWRSSCPRHSVWEDALLSGLIEVVEAGDILDQCQVVLTERGRMKLLL